MEHYFPLMVDLNGRLVVVIGGGRVAARKVNTLMKSGKGAPIRIVSPQLDPSLYTFWKQKRIEYVAQRFAPSHIDDADFIVAATNNREVNQCVADHVRNDQWVNVVDDPKRSTFSFPALVERGPLKISVSTSGCSPGLAAKIKNEIMGHYDERYADYVSFIGKCRSHILEAVDDAEKQQQLLAELLDPMFLELTRQGKINERQQRFEQLL